MISLSSGLASFYHGGMDFSKEEIRKKKETKIKRNM
jgi:hypothetical protein